MPKKQPGMTPEEQSQSFRDTVQRMIDAGELNPTEADKAFERLAHSLARQGQPKP